MNIPATEQSIGFLVTDISRLIRKLADRRLVAIGLTRAQCHALISLERLGPLTQAALAEIMEVETATIARSVARLDVAGWVQRRRDQRDGRTKIVSATYKATVIMGEIAEIAQRLAEDILSDLSQSDHENLIAWLGVLKSRLNHLLAAEQRP
jgi:DNA-binding MarR family transcriptional regulator